MSRKKKKNVCSVSNKKKVKEIFGKNSPEYRKYKKKCPK